MSPSIPAWLRILLTLACAGAASSQTRIDLRTQGKGVDFSGAAFTKPSKSGTVLPPSCSVGEEFFKTDAPAGQNKFGCTAPDVWSQLAGIVNFPGQLGNDFVTTASSTVLSTQAGARAFGTLRVASAACTFTITAGSINGLAYEYLTDSGQVVLLHPSGSGSLALSVAGNNCQASAVAVPGWPTGMNFHPIATVAVENGHWGALTPYPSLSAGWYVVCAANLACSYSDGMVVVDAGANVLLAGGANIVTGSLDLSGAQFLNVPRGASDPAQCQGGVGALFYNTASGALKTCTAAAPATWTSVSPPTFSTVAEIELSAAACHNAAASLTGNTGASAPAAVCLSGSNTVQAAAQFTPGGPSVQYRLALPDDWSVGAGNDVEFLFASPGGTGQVVWNLQTACVARTGAGLDPAWNPAQTASTAVLASGLSNAVTLSGWNATGCAPGRLLYLKVALDGSTTVASQNLLAVRLKLRRAVTPL